MQKRVLFHTRAPPIQACLNSQSPRQIGHFCSEFLPSNHFVMHRKWNACEQTPHTTGESSPGYLQSGAHPSYGEWQIPHTSDASFHVHVATPCHVLNLSLSGISFFVSPSLSSLLSVLFGAFSFIFRLFLNRRQVVKSSSRQVLFPRKKARARVREERQTTERRETDDREKTKSKSSRKTRGRRTVEKKKTFLSFLPFFAFFLRETKWDGGEREREEEFSSHSKSKALEPHI